MRGYLDSNPAGYPPMTWTQFSEVFLGKYMPLSVREHLRDKFTALRQDFMTVVEYEVRFHELARHATMILDTEYERIRCFIWGLRLSLRRDTQSLVTSGKSFSEIADHVYSIEEMDHKAQGGNDKRPCYQAVTLVHSSQAEDFTIGTLISSLLSIRVNLVSQFKYHFRYIRQGSTRL